MLLNSFGSTTAHQTQFKFVTMTNLLCSDGCSCFDGWGDWYWAVGYLGCLSSHCSGRTCEVRKPACIDDVLHKLNNNQFGSSIMEN